MEKFPADFVEFIIKTVKKPGSTFDRTDAAMIKIPNDKGFSNFGTRVALDDGVKKMEHDV